MTIREQIIQYKDKLSSKKELTPEDASKILVELTAIWGNVNSNLIDAQMDFNKIKLKYLDEGTSVAKAEIKAQISDEYKWYQEVKGYSELVKEMIRGLKYYLRACQDELNNYQ